LSEAAAKAQEDSKPDEAQGAAGGRTIQRRWCASCSASSRIKLELVINLKTARAIGLEIPPLILARADQVIE
jgi:putative ABC transport system substrate-binding protein